MSKMNTQSRGKLWGFVALLTGLVALITNLRWVYYQREMEAAYYNALALAEARGQEVDDAQDAIDEYSQTIDQIRRYVPGKHHPNESVAVRVALLVTNWRRLIAAHQRAIAELSNRIVADAKNKENYDKALEAFDYQYNVDWKEPGGISDYEADEFFAQNPDKRPKSDQNRVMDEAVATAQRGGGDDFNARLSRATTQAEVDRLYTERGKATPGSVLTLDEHDAKYRKLFTEAKTDAEWARASAMHNAEHAAKYEGRATSNADNERVIDMQQADREAMMARLKALVDNGNILFPVEYTKGQMVRVVDAAVQIAAGYKADGAALKNIEVVVPEGAGVPSIEVTCAGGKKHAVFMGNGLIALNSDLRGPLWSDPEK